MDLDRPPAEPMDRPESTWTSHAQDRIIQRLVRRGIPLDHHLDQPQRYLVSFLQGNKSLLSEVISDILPTIQDVSELDMIYGVRDEFVDSLQWLQWLMFEDEPRLFLGRLAEQACHQRAVCGAVWGHRDLAYRCRTCELDPTCAICVPCFQNGNHKDHDYSIIYTGNGCCDCGDVTAWKQEGFCSKHTGTEKIQPLSDELANSIGPVLDVLLLIWKDMLLAVEGDDDEASQGEDSNRDLKKKAANEVTCAIVDMLLDFCNCSENLLCFVSKRISSSPNLLHLLVKGEVFLDRTADTDTDTDTVKKLQELLLKLMGEPVFKYDFAKAFINYYPHAIDRAVKAYSDLERTYPLLSTFSVQIFTVPTLTPRLVKDVNLLDVLLGCLKHLFRSCTGEDGCLQAVRFSNLYNTVIRLLHDIRFTLTHDEVIRYILHERLDVFRTWICLLGHVQGADPQKRLTGFHVEEENDKLYHTFQLMDDLEIINNLLIEGAFSMEKVERVKHSYFDSSGKEDFDGDCQTRLAKVGRISNEKSVLIMRNRDSSSSFSSASMEEDSCTRSPSIPPIITWLSFECVKAIENWMQPDVTSSLNVGRSSFWSLQNLRKRLFQSRSPNTNRSVSQKPTSWQYSGGFGQALQGKQLEGTDTCSDVPGRNVVPGIETSDLLANDTCPNNLHAEVHSDMEFEKLGAFSVAEWPEIVFDVSSQEISFHIPFHRLLSLLLRKAMKSCCSEAGHFGIASGILFIPDSRLDFFGSFLKGFHPYGFSSYIMEHPLRLRVFCAQVNAGMWRRNGDASLILSDLYYDVRCFEIGVEVDLFLLQCCAALAPPEEFVTRVQERFGLLNYLSLNLGEYNEYEPILVKEMLSLFIQIVKERRFCGLSTTENLRRELIHKLALGDATHSQLLNALPKDLSEVKELQNVVDALSTYRKASGMKQGVYSLQNECWKELDLYYPRWNVRDVQDAEERYLRFCKTSPLVAQQPQWTKIFSPLNMIWKIATTKAVLQIVRAVMFYAVFTERPSASRAPDDVLIRALHLLSLSLDICEKHKEVCLNKGGESSNASYVSDLSCVNISCSEEDSIPLLMFATEVIGASKDKAPALSEHHSLLSLLVLLMRKQTKENDQNPAESRGCNLSSLIEGLLERFGRLSADCMRELKHLAPDVVFRITQLSSNNDAHKLKLASTLKDQKAKARERQAAILEKMRAEQSKFIETLKSNASNDFDVPDSEEGQFEEELAPVCSLCHDKDPRIPLSVLVLLEKSRISTFTDRGPPSWEDNIESDKAHNSTTEEISSDYSTGSSVSSEVASHTEFASTHTQASRHGVHRSVQQPVLSNNTERNTLLAVEMTEDDVYRAILEDVFPVGHNISSLSSNISHSSVEGLLRYSSTSPMSDLPFKDHFGPINCDGIHISSCGHAVHKECHDRYLSSLRERGHNFEGGRLVDPNMGELLCPVCRRISNSILPLLPGDCSIDWEKTMLPKSSWTDAGYSVRSVMADNTLCVLHALSFLFSSAEMIKQGRFSNVLPANMNNQLESVLKPAVHKLNELYFPHDDSNVTPWCTFSNSLMLWDTLRYTIISTEIAARGRESASSGNSNSVIDVLYLDLCSSNGHALSKLLHVAQSTRSLDRSQLPLRFEAVHLFASSICAGIPGASNSSDAGTFSSFLQDADDDGGGFPAQFWKFAAAPILIHDPFSSLMWILFSLPLPFLLSPEAFLSLVHLLYIVCVIQALITCHGRHHFDTSSFDGCVLNSICKTMGKTEFARQYFASNYVDDSRNLKDMVRKLTFPYLRRCALLWKLLDLPMPSSCCDNSHVRDIPYNIGSPPTELSWVTQIENLFQIRSLEHIYNDNIVHALALKWSEQLFQYFNATKPGYVLYCNPAAPFKLMQLPLLYQDLLQRYVKHHCPDCKSIPKEPALCLLCGRLCSPSWRPCCSASNCKVHAKKCGAGIGVFLLIRNTSILLQRSVRLALWPSPYLDAFGEEDNNMSRGKPLYLSQERYSALTYLVASHGLDRSSEVLLRSTTGF